MQLCVANICTFFRMSKVPVTIRGRACEKRVSAPKMQLFSSMQIILPFARNEMVLRCMIYLWHRNRKPIWGEKFVRKAIYRIIHHSFVIPQPPCVPSKWKYAITRNLHPTSAPYRKYKNQERSCFAKLKYKIGKYEEEKNMKQIPPVKVGWE